MLPDVSFLLVGPDMFGSHVFNHSTLRVLVAVAVEQEAYNLLGSFFRCSEATSIRRQLNQQLLATKGENQIGLGNLAHQLLKRYFCRFVKVVLILYVMENWRIYKPIWPKSLHIIKRPSY